METTNIVDKLIRGSQNIDRMRSEVIWVVGMILGFLEKESGLPEGGPERSFHSNGCEWLLRRKIKGAGLVVQCLIEGEVAYYSTMRDPIFLPKAQRVHDGLIIFVEGSIREFPFLAEKLKPLLNASEKF